MTTGDTPPANGGPTSWRDVYSLVQDVEKRLTDRIDDGISTVRFGQADHETRIRLMEATALPDTKIAVAQGVANSIRILALEKLNDADDNRKMGQVQVITYGQKVILFAVFLVNAAIAIIGFVVSK